jgi:hypothetical protein
MQTKWCIYVINVAIIHAVINLWCQPTSNGLFVRRKRNITTRTIFLKSFYMNLSFDCCSGLPDGCILRPKIAIWVNFGGACNRWCWYIVRTFGLLYSHLIYFMVIWYILRQFGTYIPFWYITTRKIWQPYCCYSEDKCMTSFFIRFILLISSWNSFLFVNFLLAFLTKFNKE